MLFDDIPSLQETVSQILFCHPEFISGSHNHLILSDAETILKQAQHKVQHDIFQHVAIATQSPRKSNVDDEGKGG